MDKEQADPLARILIKARADIAVYSAETIDRLGSPPTAMAKIHHMRSAAQALIYKDDRYLLCSEYSEFGSIQVTVVETGESVLLKSRSAITIESASKGPALFNVADYETSNIGLLVFSFGQEELELGTATARHLINRRHLSAADYPMHLGVWPYILDETTFAQGEDDPFGDLGDLGDLGDGDPQ
jgi:hypothetical protein